MLLLSMYMDGYFTCAAYRHSLVMMSNFVGSTYRHVDIWHVDMLMVVRVDQSIDDIFLVTLFFFSCPY